MIRMHNEETFKINREIIHGNNYDYMEEYSTGKVKILMRHVICDYVFRQTPSHHIYSKRGCPKCGGSLLKTHNEFLSDAKKVHGDNYDYLGKYVNAKTPLLMKHFYCGFRFHQSPDSHLKGRGCPKCGGHMLKKHSEFLSDAHKEHGDEFDYPEEYVNAHTKIRIIHKKCGRSFLQPPVNHTMGSGCKYCNNPLSENAEKIRTYLCDNSFEFVLEKRFNECKNILSLPFDFYLLDYNILIEYDGQQHFKPVEIWGGEEGLKIRQLRDSIKTQWCLDNNIPLIRIPYTIKNIEEYLENELSKLID